LFASGSDAQEIGGFQGEEIAVNCRRDGVLASGIPAGLTLSLIRAELRRMETALVRPGERFPKNSKPTHAPARFLGLRGLPIERRAVRCRSM